MTEYQDFLVEFTPRLLIYLRDPTTQIPQPKYQSDGSVLWVAVLLQPGLAIMITEKKDGSRTITFRFDKEDHVFADSEDPKMECIIAALLAEIKTKSPFYEPPAKNNGGLVGCRTYNEILEDLTEEYLKTTKLYAKGENKEEAKKRNWTHYKERLFQIIRDSAKIDPVRIQENKRIYGVTYDGETLEKKHVQIYLQFIEERGHPTILKWNDELIYCIDPRLKEVAETAIKAFRCRMKLPEKYGSPIQNFLSGYARFSLVRSQQAGNKTDVG